jgi:hypothetical protein
VVLNGLVHAPAMMVTLTDPPTSADVPEGDREAAQAVLLALSVVASGVAVEVGWVLGHQPSLPLGDLSLTDTLSVFAGQWPGAAAAAGRTVRRG